MKGGGELVGIFVVLLILTLLAGVGGLAFYLSDEPECQADSDCSSGKTCNSSGVCIDPPPEQHEHVYVSASHTPAAPTPEHGPQPINPCENTIINCGDFSSSGPVKGHCFPEGPAGSAVATCKCMPGYRYDPSITDDSKCVEDINWDIIDNKFFFGNYGDESEIGYRCHVGEVNMDNYFDMPATGSDEGQAVCMNWTCSGIVGESSDRAGQACQDAVNTMIQTNEKKETEAKDWCRQMSGEGGCTLNEELTTQHINYNGEFNCEDPSNLQGAIGMPTANQQRSNLNKYKIINHCFTTESYQKLTGHEKTVLQSHLDSIDSELCSLPGSDGSDGSTFDSCKRIVDYFNNEFIKHDSIQGSDKYHFGLNRYGIDEQGKIKCLLSDDGNEDKKMSNQEKPETGLLSGAGINIDDLCIRKSPDVTQLKAELENSSGVSSCTQGDIDNIRCECNDRYIGRICNIRMDELCGENNTIRNLNQISQKDKSDPLFGYGIRYDNDDDKYKVKPNYEGSLYYVPIDNDQDTIKANKTPVLSTQLTESCICNPSNGEGGPFDRRGLEYTGFDMDPDKYCNCPITSNTRGSGNTASTESTVNAPWQVLYYNPAETIFSRGDETNITKKTLFNQRCYMDCGDTEFSLGDSNSEDNGYRTGRFYSHEYDGVPKCDFCDRTVNAGTNLIKINRYLGWGSDDYNYEDYKAKYSSMSKDDGRTGGKDTTFINNLIDKKNYNSVRSFNDIFQSYSTDTRSLCKPAYPGYYGSLGTMNEDEKFQQAPFTENGGQRADERITNSASRPVNTDYEKKKTSTISGLQCPPEKSFNWGPKNFAIKNCDMATFNHFADGQDLILDYGNFSDYTQMDSPNDGVWRLKPRASECFSGQPLCKAGNAIRKNWNYTDGDTSAFMATANTQLNTICNGYYKIEDNNIYTAVPQTGASTSLTNQCSHGETWGFNGDDGCAGGNGVDDGWVQIGCEWQIPAAT